MTKARPKPYSPAAGEDWGQTTETATRGTIVEPVPEDANRRRRRRRLAPWEDPRGLGAKLSQRQRAAAAALHERHVATQLSPTASMVFVDRTPDHGLTAAMATDRLMKRAMLWRHVPTAQAAVTFHVCAEGRALRDPAEPYSRNGIEQSQHEAELMVALDCVANAMGL